MKLRNKVFLALLFMSFLFKMQAQNSNDREAIKKQTNLKELRNIIERTAKPQNFFQNKSVSLNIPLTIIQDGRLGILFDIDQNGKPIYAFDDEDNIDAAISCNANALWQGGSLGLNLDGSGIEIGVWESGYALPSHQEFGGRASNAGDGGSVSSHGSHTGGTLIASGVDASARGMASGATVKNYTASNMVSETASFAAAGGILANNSNTPSGVAGDYNAVARDMDNVLYNAPFYTHCKSAGNDGNTYGVLKSTQLSKNLIVVGNTQDVPNYTGPSSVTMWTSSSYGPTSDWRIKPDIVNNGRSVYSCDNTGNAAYAIKTGTSMSTPATAGVIALLQQHYKNRNNIYMKSATVRALIINTAEEVATPGPDFASGWGLLNAEKAANLISGKGVSSLIDELSLSNGSTYTTTITSDGSTPITATIAWNDPGGVTGSGRSPVLVNDLDMRITGNGNTYSPWIMVPNSNYDNYSDAAQKGDNFRDNVEQINSILPAGTYTITVSHKGTLTNGSQDFSLIVNGTSIINDSTTPSVPTNVVASNIGDTTLDLSWTSSTDNVGVSGYEVFRNGSSIGTSVSNSYSVTGLSAETSYEFTVLAYDASGNKSSASTPISVTTTSTPSCAGITGFPYSESFESGVGVWVQETNDDMDWIVDSAGTPSNNTGPSAASDGTSYIYTEATGNGTGFPNKVAILTSPCIDLTGQPNPELNFDYHMYGAAMGTLEINVSTDDGGTWNALWSKSGDQGNNWLSQNVSLLSYSGSVIKLQIKGTTGSDFTSDMTVDNLRILSVVPDTQAPSVPTNVVASNIQNTSVDLNWNASTDNVGVAQYDIYQDGIAIASTIDTFYSISGLTADTNYIFNITASDAAGNTSGQSNPVDVTTTNLIQYFLNTAVIGQGSVTGGGTYNSGETVSLSANPATGWEFDGWNGDLSGTTNPANIVMNSNKSVTATFTEVIQVSTSTERYRLTWRDDPSTTIVVGWNQVRGTNPIVYYGTIDQGLNYSAYSNNKSVDRTVSSKGMTNMYARLTGLQPDTAYYFVIRDSEGVSERFWFRTAPNDPNTRLSIVAGGDSRNNRTPRQNANKMVAKLRPHAVFFGGDMTSSSTNSQWQNWFDDWQLTIGSDGRMIPIVAARGNHESANDIRDLFDIPTSAGGEFYALSFGGNLLRSYTLNTEVTPAGTQGTWLENDLTNNSANHIWAVAQYHRSTRPHEPGKSEQNDQYDAWSLPFYQHGVQLVMESDSHVVKRTWPIIPSTGAGSDEGFVRADNDPNRAVYVGEGCWGAPLRTASDTKSWTRAAGSFNQFKWLWVDKTRIELRTLKVDEVNTVGQVSDNNMFSVNLGNSLWNPTGGSVVIIDNPHSLTSLTSTASIDSSDDDEPLVGNDFIVYPNPIESGLLKISYKSKVNGSYKIYIKDFMGKRIEEIKAISENVTYNIDRLNAGVYFIILKDGNKEISKKFIKK